MRKNALQVLIPKYGLEGTLYLNSPTASSVTFAYNPEDQSQTCGNIVFRAFDPIVVQMSLDRSNVQHEKLFFKLVKPEVGAILNFPLIDSTENLSRKSLKKPVIIRNIEIYFN